MQQQERDTSMATNEPTHSALTGILHDDEAGILQTWMDLQVAAPGFRPDRISRTELSDQSRRFLTLFREALERGGNDIQSSAWSGTRQLLEDLSMTRAYQGFSPVETATFVFSLKEPLFHRLRVQLAKDPQEVASATWYTSTLLDRLGLYTTELYQRGREQVILRQQQELMELSTPVVTLWEGILALPIIGTLDSARTQVVMENLLQRIVERGSSIAIIDITGVPTVDTLTAQHLLKTVAAARLMGADCIISGIRPQIAQTIVHLGVELGSVVTKATLEDAFAVALRRLGLTVTRAASAARKRERDRPEEPVRRDDNED
jgi:rsbT co-antagonist protein RsbR